jgi:uncharacterized protein (DUF1015 family)
MEKKKLMEAFWRDVSEQNGASLRAYFSKDAVIKWHNTNERFTVEEYLIANCEYPGNWFGEIQRIEELNDTIITVVRVHDLQDGISVHATSFIKFEEEKIIEMDEYWSDDGPVPHWRLDKKIGTAIK